MREYRKDLPRLVIFFGLKLCNPADFLTFLSYLCFLLPLSFVIQRSTLWERAIKRIVEDGSSKGKHVYVVGVAGVKQKRDVEG